MAAFTIETIIIGFYHKDPLKKLINQIFIFEQFNKSY